MTTARNLAAFGTVSGQQQDNRNLLYNGAMRVAQRGTSTASITGSGYYTADRWNMPIATSGTWTQSVTSDAPTGSGFRNSLKVLCTTAQASLSAGSEMEISQTLEGQDLQRIAKGTASAQTLALSFWVKSNVTGTYIVEIRDIDNTRICCAAYTVSASATWERKTITIPADTTGVLDNDNAGSLEVKFWLAASSTFTSGTLATTWASNVNANRAVGQTNLAAAVNNYWQITGVQLETGPAATPFEFKSYGQELRDCERYYQLADAGVGVANASTSVPLNHYFRTPMRANPVINSMTAVASITDGYSADYTASSVSVGVVGGDRISNTAAQVQYNNFTGLTAGRVYIGRITGGKLILSAEL